MIPIIKKDAHSEDQFYNMFVFGRPAVNTVGIGCLGYILGVLVLRFMLTNQFSYRILRLSSIISYYFCYTLDANTVEGKSECG